MSTARQDVCELLARQRPRRARALEVARPFSAADEDVVALVADLASPETARALAVDPYWPKWGSPWWKLLLLHEAGLAHAAPAAAVDALGAAINDKYLTSFPFTLDQVPPGCDPRRDVICHCALGCATTLLRACGRDAEAVVPWSRGWFLRYQLPDGGVNCDEQVYVRALPRSSIVSTAPALEALLSRPARSAGEEAFLERGVGYLLERQLGLVSLSKGGPIDPRWSEPIFPRFYLYDLLRGLSLVTRWADDVGGDLPASQVLPALAALAARVRDDGTLAPARDDHARARTLALVDGAWKEGQPASTFALLERARRGDVASAPLTRAWYDALDALATLDAEGRLL